jgi:hypothetical protein
VADEYSLIGLQMEIYIFQLDKPLAPIQSRMFVSDSAEIKANNARLSVLCFAFKVEGVLLRGSHDNNWYKSCAVI